MSRDLTVFPRWLDLARRLLATLALTTVTALLVVAPAAAAEPSLYPLPTETRGSGLTAGPDGAMWFIGRHGGQYKGGEGEYIGRVAGDWEVTEFPLPKGVAGGAPVAGPEGDLWFPTRTAGKGHHFGVTRMTTAGQMHEFTLSTLQGGIGQIAASGDEILATSRRWQHGKFKDDTLDRYLVSPTGVTLQQRIVFRSACQAAAVVGDAGGFWYAEQCEPHRPRKPAWHARLVRLAGGVEVASYRLPYKSFVPTLTIDAEGAVWFGNLGENGIHTEFGRVAPSGQITSWPVPNADPDSIAVGPEGRLWFGLYGKDRAVRELDSIGPSGDLGTPICAGPKCKYTPYSLATGPDGQLWYSAEHAHIPYGGGGGGALIQDEYIAKESGFLARLSVDTAAAATATAHAERGRPAVPQGSVTGLSRGVSGG
jgi:streptogramin lyase